jgi:AcrR family transcriptional regulator
LARLRKSVAQVCTLARDHGAAAGMTVVSIPSARRAKARRRAPEIIDAAARVFAERGFHGATTQDIADVLGIRQASLYYYFASKEGALELVCLKGVEGFFDRAKVIAQSPRRPGEKLEKLIASHLSPLIDRSDYVKVFLSDRQNLPTESRRRIGKWSRGLERIFEDVLREGVRTGEFRVNLDTRLATLAILGMLNAVVTWYRKEDVAIARIADEFARMALRGVLKSPIRVGKARSSRPPRAKRAGVGRSVAFPIKL